MYDAQRTPDFGTSYVDPVFGCSVRRISDGMTQFGVGVHHQYSLVSPFNADTSRVLLGQATGDQYVVDLDGNIIVTPERLALTDDNQPLWSPVAASRLYYVGGNQLMTYDIDSGERQTIAVFSDYEWVGFSRYGKTDISLDGDHVVIVGTPPGSATPTTIHLYAIGTNSLSPGFTPPAGLEPNYCTVTPGNNVVCMYTDEGAERYQGVELFDGNMTFVRQVISFQGHADVGRDVNGDEIMVIVGGDDTEPAAGCEVNGIEKVRLYDSQKTCLLPLGVNDGESTHVSLRDVSGDPWVVIENTDLSPQSTAALPAPGDWQERWSVYDNEVVLLSLDGSRAWRLAHHRSRWLGEYWYQPRVSISRDGTYVIFDSNFGLAPSPDYTDAYVIRLK
ncbi:MAG: hypothetical protein DMD81_11170 [Candidatus Rokuibacteriota bacterium]|nr:MAG: hypothetical protein DMD81_11170 [Candidatus Rokubacteria bacterium]